MSRTLFVALSLILFMSQALSAGESELQLIEAASKGNITQVKNLLSHGTDVNARGDDGRTALMLAAQNGHTNIVQALLEHNADVQASANDGSTALTAATDNGYTAIVQLLKNARKAGR